MLYFVATPIGNLDEITLRALDVLRSVDLIAAEDTRHTAVLLNKYDIKTRMIAYHKFNEKSVVGGILDLALQGKNIAVVSDAGMPTVSDPGHILIDAAIERGVKFTVISGACAGIDALVLSGLDTRAFSILGFLPEKNIDRKRFIDAYVNLPSTLVFYSAVHDIKKDLDFLYAELGARRVAVCREMTKLYESVTRGRLGDNLDIVEKGEFAIVVEGANVRQNSGISAEDGIKAYVAQGMDVRDAVKKVAFEKGVAKSEIYKVSVAMKERGEL